MTTYEVICEAIEGKDKSFHPQRYTLRDAVQMAWMQIITGRYWSVSIKRNGTHIGYVAPSKGKYYWFDAEGEKHSLESVR